MRKGRHPPSSEGGATLLHPPSPQMRAGGGAKQGRMKLGYTCLPEFRITQHERDLIVNLKE